MDISISGIISWIIFGFIVGTVMHLLDARAVKGGILGTIATGILGAVAGGFLANIFLGLTITGFNLQSFLIAIGGAFLLTLIQRIIFRDRHKVKTDINRFK